MGHQYGKTSARLQRRQLWSLLQQQQIQTHQQIQTRMQCSLISGSQTRPFKTSRASTSPRSVNMTMLWTPAG